MSKVAKVELSIVVPVYNEAASLEAFHTSLTKILKALNMQWNVLYVDDGSTDESNHIIHRFTKKDPNVKLLSFSRNFGKENALSAGINQAEGSAILTIDGDGQHPVELIPEFIAKWQAGAKVVVGVRTNHSSSQVMKSLSSSLFYKLFNRMSRDHLIPGSTDFRLIDEQVRTAFNDLPEQDRMTRSLIDWLGFKRDYVHFTSHDRLSGTPVYSHRKLTELAMNSIISSTVLPLYLFGYLGIGITIFSFILGAVVFLEQIVLEDPLGWQFTGTAMLGILIVFLVGLVLLSQGLLSLYVSQIHREAKNRPLYVIDYERSVGVHRESRS